MQTLLSTLTAALAAPAHGDGLPPAAVLWPDPAEDFAALLPALRAAAPRLHALGAYDPAARTGPAIWLRCVVEGVLPEPPAGEHPAGEHPPVFHLPGVSTAELAAGESCPEPLRPLVELLHRGTRWKQANGKDWTLRAFLLRQGLDVAGDAATATALRRAAGRLADEPLERWRGRRLTAADFDALLVDDHARLTLRWLGDPETLNNLPAAERDAFAEQLKAKYGLDPQADGPLAAAERLAAAQGPWGTLWQRFEEAPDRFPGVRERLGAVQPAGLFPSVAHYPAANAAAEAGLADALAALPEQPVAAARAALGKLEAEHADRRQTMWDTPWADLLAPLAALARLTARPAPGDDPEAMAAAWGGEALDAGWRADAAACDALAVAGPTERAVAEAVVRHLLLPWQDEAARRFQQMVAASPLPDHRGAETVEAPEASCVLFADGLRFDLGHRLAARLRERSFRVELSRRWAALPTVTATAKPAASPAAGAVVGHDLPPTFCPVVAATGKPADAPAVRALAAEAGHRPVPPGDDEGPGGARGWSECGDLDADGHKLGLRLAGQLPRHLDDLERRVGELLASGFAAVRVVSDHGWLLMPGGLPVADLPKHLTASRWSRCATLEEGTAPDALTAPWHWNPEREFAHAPGVSAFNRKGVVYAHGGLSLQECVTPDLVVRPAEGAGAPAAAPTLSASWKRLRCHAEGRGFPPGTRVDLRATAGGPSLAQSVKELDPDGLATLLLPEPDLVGEPALLVALAPDATPLAQLALTLGG